jgi:chitinase
MLDPRRTIVSLSVVLLSGAAASARAANCAGVAQWNPDTSYLRGALVLYQGRLYEAQTQTARAAPDTCASCYALVGKCDDVDNPGPIVHLTSPTDGASLPAGAALTLTAEASNGEIGIARVDFFQGETFIGVSTAPPFGFTWENVPPGTYLLRAVATDTTGARSVSPSISITVTTSGGSCTAAAYVPRARYATGQQVQTRGELYRCDVARYCSAKAVDAYAPGEGSRWPDAWTFLGPCTEAGAPSVSVAYPAPGSIFDVGSDVTIAADAGNGDSPLLKVEFFADGNKIGEDTEAPYGVTWSNAAPGAHALAARAVDNAGKSTTSDAISIVVAATPPPPPPAAQAGPDQPAEKP